MIGRALLSVTMAAARTTGLDHSFVLQGPILSRADLAIKAMEGNVNFVIGGCKPDMGQWTSHGGETE